MIGGSAVIMWSSLALLTTLSGVIPPFQLTAMTFSIAFVLGLVKWSFNPSKAISALRQPLPVWAFGVVGLFGYHFFYFMALRNAPPIEAGLIAYTWPLLIVVCSALLPGENLRWFHIVGAIAGLLGTFALVSGGGLSMDNFKSHYALGYLMAVACALTWTGYSLISRKFSDVPSDIIGGYCGLTAVLSLICHLIFETTVLPEFGTLSPQWLAILGLGLGPVGLAFFTWDYGVKNGAIQALGASSYAAPLLSTLLLIAFGMGELNWNIAVACALITGGAVIASKDLLFPTPDR